MQKLVWQNANGVELDLTSGNYGITEWEGFANTSLNIQSQQVPFQDGGVFLDALMEQREMTITLAIQDNNNLSLRYQQRRELISALNPKLGEGYLIYTNDYISKRIKCIPQIPIFETHNSDTAGTPKASLSWTACEPYWEDLEETTVELPTQTPIENNGDVPCQIKAVLNAGASNPVLYNKANQKQIGLEGGYDYDIEINTNFGNKSIKTSEIKYKWVAGGELNTICFGQGKFIFAGTVMFVKEFLTDKTYGVNLPSSRRQIDKVIFANNKFFAVGAYFTLLTSSDGKEWSQQNLDSGSGHLRSIIYANNLYVAVGDSRQLDGRIFTSTDGISWTRRTSGVDKQLYDIAYGNGLFVVVGVDGTLLTSPDGITWTTRTIPNVYHYYGVAYSGSVFVAVSSNCIIYSYDGITWTAEESSNFGFSNVKYLNNRFLAGGDLGRIGISEDGFNWQRINLETRIGIRAFEYAYNHYLATGKRGAIYRSADGIEWELENNVAPRDTATLHAITFGQNNFVSVGSYETTKSNDSENWEYTDINTFSMNHIAYANNIFVAVGSNGKILKSTDGQTWIEKTSGVSSSLRSVCFGAGLFVICGSSGTILTSENGETWTQQTTGTVNSLSCITYAKGKFVCLKDGQREVLISEDGTDWTTYTEITETMQEPHGLTFGKNIFVAVGGSSYPTVMTSTDGINWVVRLTGGTLTGYLMSVVFTGKMFVAVGTNGRIMTSLDGIEWTEQESGVSTTLEGVAFGEDKIVAVGQDSVIFNSYLAGTQNIIADLTPESDMTFDLEQGENEILYLTDGNTQATLTYRQKYIGV